MPTVAIVYFSAQGHAPTNDGDRKSAAILGKRVAGAAARWAKGK